MARVTVEDCVTKVPNRFRLVMLAAQRARDLSVGTPLLVDRDNDKNPVVALREIAEDMVTPEDLEEALIQGLQQHANSDDLEEETTELLAIEEELAATAGADLIAEEISDSSLQVQASTEVEEIAEAAETAETAEAEEADVPELDELASPEKPEND